MNTFFFALEDVFLKIFNMSLTAVWIILAVMLLRLVFKKAPKTLVCALWILAAVRLVVPFPFESSLSLVPSGDVVRKSSAAGSFIPGAAVSTGFEYLNSVISSAEPPAITEPESTLDVMKVLSVVWAVGVLAVLIYALASFLSLQKKVSASVKYKDDVFFCDNIASPFILGVFKPKIYLPSTIDEGKIEAVLAHEKAHLKRKDNLIKPLAFLILSVHWFNPLCVLAYVLLCRDIELACDERVIKTLSLDERKEYSQTLLDLSVKRKTISACPLAFGEVGVKERIKNVLNYKKPAFWVIVVALVACVLATVFFVTNPKEKEPFENDVIKVVKIESEEPSVTFKLLSAEVNPDGLKLVIRWKNDSEKVISYGESYTVSFLKSKEKGNPSWIDNKLPYAFDLVAYTVSPNGTDEHSYSLSSSATEIGRYKLETVFNYGNANEAEERKISLTFDLKKEIEITDGSSGSVDGAAKKMLGGSKLLDFFGLEKLSEKGESLSAKDFEEFAYYETGSGICIRVYPINDKLEAWLGFNGDPEKDEPMYFTLMVSGKENIDMKNSAELQSYLRTHTDELIENVLSSKILERSGNEGKEKNAAYVAESHKILVTNENGTEASVYFAQTDMGFTEPISDTESPSTVFENNRFGVAVFEVKNKKYSLSKITFLTKGGIEEKLPADVLEKTKAFDFSVLKKSCEERAKNYFNSVVRVYRYEDSRGCYSELRLFPDEKRFDITIPLYMSSFIHGTYEEKDGKLILHPQSVSGETYVFKIENGSYIFDKEKSSHDILLLSDEELILGNNTVPDGAKFVFNDFEE